MIVTFAYRAFSKETFDLESIASPGLFTSIVVTQHLSGTNAETSVSVAERTISRQIMTVQTGTIKQQKMGDVSVFCIEEGTSADGCPGTLNDGEQ